MNHNPIIVALDVESPQQARQLVTAIGDAAAVYKVGLELYAAGGRAFVRELLEEGRRVFLDLKFYDIGETVKRAVAQVASSGVEFLTVHGSRAVMRAAVEGKESSKLKLLAVTVLTSFDKQDLEELGYPCGVEELVQLRVRLARECGIDGIVCSALEASGVRRTLGPDGIIVTPGVRSRGAATGDQKRITTPKEALAAGANYVVIGRQITRAPDPAAEAKRILEEICSGS